MNIEVISKRTETKEEYNILLDGISYTATITIENNDIDYKDFTIRQDFERWIKHETDTKLFEIIADFVFRYRSSQRNKNNTAEVKF